MVKSEAEIMTDMSCATWDRDHPGKKCPQERISRDERTVITWVVRNYEQTEPAIQEYARRLTRLYNGKVLRAPCDGRVDGHDIAFNSMYVGAYYALLDDTDPSSAPIQSSADLPKEWRNLLVVMEWLDQGPPPPSVILPDIYRTVRATPAAKHPHAPLIASWQRHSEIKVKADQRDRAIVPAPLRDAAFKQEELAFALDRNAPLGPLPDPEQGHLPGMEPELSVVPTVPWLALDHRTQRLFVEVLTSVHRSQRDPEWITVPEITLRNLFEWLWPRWYDAEADRMRGGYNRAKHFEPLCRALVGVDKLRILYDRYRRRLIRVDDLPTTSTRLDDPVIFHVRHIPGSDHGPSFVRAQARHWGLLSAPAYRATIRLAYIWDEAKLRNNGARIYATRPVVARGPDGVILDKDDRPVRERGRFVKDWSHPRAVRLGANGKPASDNNPPAFERNPAADRVPVLGPDDQIRLCYNDDLGKNRPKRLLLGRRALEAKERAGEIVLEWVGRGGVRIIEARAK